MILVIDNYDSFTWNLVDYLRTLGASVEVVKNDEISAGEAMAAPAAGYVLSPGPGGPEEAGISLAVVAGCEAQHRPLLGVCLGHQAIGRHFGGTVARTAPVHGKTSPVVHNGAGLFGGLPTPFSVARYHSLAVLAEGLPDCLRIDATGQGAVMAVSHRSLPIYGVQFHPESVASDQGHALLANFLRLAAERGGDSRGCAEAGA
jgi:anthranilate synthase component 2